MEYNLIGHGDAASMTVFHNGRAYVATNEHPYWEKIREKALAGDESVVDLFSLVKTVEKKFLRLSERIAVVGGEVTFDGDVVDNSLTQQVLRFIEEGVDDWQPLVNFWEKVATNPTQHSREQLYRFLTNKNLTITEDGDILAYKGVGKSDKDGYEFASIHSGSNTVRVDGVEQTGRVHQNVGSIVEMSRETVNHDPSVGCSTGLHVSTYSFAEGYAASGGMLLVRVNPRDFVSVPDDGFTEKARVSRYVVEEIVSEPRTEPVYVREYDDGLDDEDDYDDDYLYDIGYDPYYDDSPEWTI